jgi:hypothetical protein
MCEPHNLRPHPSSARLAALDLGVQVVDVRVADGDQVMPPLAQLSWGKIKATCHPSA